MKKFTLLFLLLLGTAPAWAALPQNMSWRFSGWSGGGAYPMVTPDPQVPGRVYLISDVAGVWQSDDRGERWNFKTQGLKNIKIVALAAAPSNSNILYAATAIGIHRSSNAGTDWTYLAATSNILFIRPDNYHALAVDASNPNKLFAGTREGRVLSSVDGGNTWQDLGSSAYPFGVGVAISSLSITPDGANVLAGSVSGLRRYSFQNGVWSAPAILAAKIYDIASFDQTIYVTLGKKVAWSSNQGVSWNYSSDISATSGEAYRVSVTGGLAGTVKIFVGWRDGWSGRMYLSPNGGSTWSESGKNIIYDVAGNPTRAWKKDLTWPLSAMFDPFNANILYFSDYWGVYRSEDGGQSWFEKIRGAANTIGSDIVVRGEKIFVGTMDDGLVLSDDQGATFRSLIPGLLYDGTIAGHVWRVNVNGSKIVATNSPWNAPANQILISENGGSSFAKVGAGLPTRYPLANTVWDKGYMRALARDPLDSKRYYLGIDGDDGGGFYFSVDGGYHWVRPSSQPGSLRIYNGLAVDPVEPYRIYWGAIPGRSGGGGIYRTENYGTNWSKVSSGYIFDLAVGPDQTVYAGADSDGPTLYVSTNKGNSWSVLKKFDGAGTCEGIALNPADPKQIAVSVVQWNGAVPSGVYLSQDKGLTWTDITGDLPSGSGAAAMAFKQDGSALFLARDAGTVYSLPLTLAPDTTPPTPPTGLVATLSGSQIQLSWQPSTDDSGVLTYKIYNDGTLLGSSVLPSYLISSATPGMTYTFKVVANDAAGNLSIPSNIAAVSVPPASDPTAPANLTASASGTQVSLSWTAPTRFSVYGYNIYRNGVYLKSCRTTFQQDSSVSFGTTYSYAVRAYDYSGKLSGLSATATVVIGGTADIPPPAPTALTAVVSDAQVHLSWTAPIGFLAVGYNVYRNNVFLKSSPTTSRTDADVLPGATYTYTVKAYDISNKLSGASNAATVTLQTTGSVDPKAPSDLKAVSSQGRIQLTWKAPSNFLVYGYNIYRNNIYLKSCSTTFQPDSAVAFGSTYTYTVKAYDYFGKLSNVSNSATVTVEGSP